MNCCINALNRDIKENSPEIHCPDTASLLDMLCCCYHQSKGIDPAAVRAYFDELYAHLQKTVPDQADAVMEDATKLCSAYQREAFRQGLLTGFQLYQELHQQQNN